MRMAIFEVSIEGTAISFGRNEDGEDYPYLCQDDFTFVREGADMVTVMMSVQADLDLLNIALKAKYPEHFRDDRDWEFKIVGVIKTCLIRFNANWIKEYVEDGIFTRNYEDQEN